MAGVATVPVVYLVAAELRGRRAGLMAAALAAVNPMLLWYSQEARAYALLDPPLRRLAALLRPRRALRRGAATSSGWGIASALALATHYFASSSIVGEVAGAGAPPRPRGPARALRSSPSAACCVAPLAIHQASLGHAEWIGNFRSATGSGETAATFVTGETGDIIGQPERPALAFVPLALCLAAFALLAWRGDRDERRAAALPLLAGGAAIALPVALALVAPSKDYVLARNLIPALVPLLVLVAIAVTVRGARRLGTAARRRACSSTRSASASSPATAEPSSGPTGARSPSGSASPQRPRATVTWALGEAPLQYYLSTGAFQVQAVRRLPLAGPRNRPRLPGPGAAAGAPGARARLPRSRRLNRPAALFIRRYRLPGPGLAPLRLRRLRDARLDFRTNGVLLEGVGPG